MPSNSIYRKRDLIDILRRAGFPSETLAELDAELDDPVDVRRDEAILASHGVTLNEILNRMGSSP